MVNCNGMMNLMVSNHKWFLNWFWWLMRIESGLLWCIAGHLSIHNGVWWWWRGASDDDGGDGGEMVRQPLLQITLCVIMEEVVDGFCAFKWYAGDSSLINRPISMSLPQFSLVCIFGILAESPRFFSEFMLLNVVFVPFKFLFSWTLKHSFIEYLVSFF